VNGVAQGQVYLRVSLTNFYSTNVPLIYHLRLRPIYQGTLTQPQE
jgi:hypothetical protein